MANGTKTAKAFVIEHELVVVEAFLDHVKGEVITDAEKIAELLDSEWQHHFVKKPKADGSAAS